METYFKIRYEFEKGEVFRQISNVLEQNKTGYICVADGNVLTHVQRDESYHTALYNSLFAVCDSGWVPLYLRGLFGIRRPQYCGYQIFQDIVHSCQYRMFFLGGDQKTLDALRDRLISLNPDIAGMTFMELPFSTVEKFDYANIAKQINADRPDIIWVALGAPKQEKFMYYLHPYLDRGIQIAVGAVFHFFSGLEIRRAPRWMVKCKLEFLHRLMVEPQKQFSRCRGIVSTLPQIYGNDRKRKKKISPQHLFGSQSISPIKECSIVTCFGKAPDDIDIYLHEWEEQSDMIFLLFTDDARFWKIPFNVKVIPMAFCELQVLIKKKLGSKHVPSHHYDIPIYKEQFEKIFADYLSSYRYANCRPLEKATF